MWHSTRNHRLFRNRQSDFNDYFCNGLVLVWMSAMISMYWLDGYVNLLYFKRLSLVVRKTPTMRIRENNSNYNSGQQNLFTGKTNRRDQTFQNHFSC